MGVALSALFLLNLHLLRREPPLVCIGEIKAAMNFSKVRVRGVLKSDARMLRDGTVLYLIADETGSLPVFLNRAPTGKLPKAGNPVAATGRLSVGAGNQVRMRVHEAGQIEVLDNASPTTVRGRVAGVWVPSPDSKAPCRITLARPGGSLEIVHWFKPEHQVAVGEQLEIKGTVGFYKGRMQLKVQKPSDIRLHPEG
ncbi:MAG: OB-fold nucleic acid binding domain-containing protein [Verrucomicrobia bacterium]|nr:OB-fold nucleic acid binding domain-containing protein [Verrucomicrobiota bacterium]